MDLVTNGSFVIIPRMPHDVSVCVPVGIKTPQGIVRLWDDAKPDSWQEEREYVSHVRAWTLDEAVIISPNHPRYPEWWAWYCRGRLGMIDCPPEIERYV